MKAEVLRKTELEAFIDFSDVIYQADYRTEDSQELRQIILGQHPLSHYFSTLPLVVKEGHQIIARAVLTFYPADSTAYLGYFESLDHPAAARQLFELAAEEAHLQGKTAIEGPLNASFWLGYRLKMSHFEKQPYFTELYHPPYYQKLWKENGYSKAETYYSNRYASVDERMGQGKYQKRYKAFLEKGYQIKNPTGKTIDRDFLTVVKMIQERFQSFPVYKAIETEEFMTLFADLKRILHYRYVKLAFDGNGELAGFLVSVPNYGNLFKQEKRRMGTILRFLWKKYTTREYIILYMGVKAGHEGLGSALVYALMQEYQTYKIKGISSYIQSGKVSGSYAFPSIETQSEYGYYRKQL